MASIFYPPPLFADFFYLEENSWRARPLKGYVFGTLRKHVHDESWELWVLPDTLEPVEALL